VFLDLNQATNAAGEARDAAAVVQRALNPPAADEERDA
jgi:hypothetical protein